MTRNIHHVDSVQNLLAVHLGGIPEALKRQPQWVLWKLEHRDDKLTKVPYDAKTGRPAKTNDPSTWSDIIACQNELLSSNGGYQGLGFALKPGGGIVGIDVDLPVDSPLCVEFRRRFQGSYCERSPSGNFRCFCLGTVKRTGKGSQDELIEVYDGSRYLTVTGHHIEGTAPDLTPQPEALNWLHETHMVDRFALEKEAQRPPSQAHDPALPEAARRVLEKAFSAANGNKVKALYEGRWRELGYPSQSDADLALVSTLTFWTCDEDLLDHLFRQSALMRAKWDEKHYADGTTYGKATLIEAIKGRGQGYRWETQSNAALRSEKLKGGKDRKPCVIAVTLSDFLRRELPKQEAILSPWLLKQSLNMIYAWRGVGKTHVALGIAYAVAAGGRFLSWQAETPHGVLYIDGEMPAAAMQQRLSQIALASEKEASPDLFRIITPDLQDSFMPDLATIEGQKAFDEHITDDTQLIIADNLSSLVRRGGCENDAESWLGVGEWAMEKRAQGKSVLFLHNAGKSGAQRGTSKREDILDTVMCLRRPSDYDPAREGARFEVIFEKNRHKADVEPFEAALTTDPSGRQVWVTRNVEQYRDAQILELYELGLSMPDIADELSINKSTVSRALHRMEEQGRVTLGKGRRGSKLQGARA